MRAREMFYFGSLVAGFLWLPGIAWAACTLGQSGAVSVYSLSGQGNFSCRDLNMDPVSGVAATLDGQTLNWTLGSAAEVDTVVVEDSSGKRCVYNYGPGVTGGTGLTPPANKSIADSLFCADDVVLPPPNTPPEATIQLPVEASVPGGQEVEFAGSANDAEDEGLTGADLTWSSSLDGPLGSGSLIFASDLSPGEHVITAQVTDSGGLIGSDSILLTVEATEAQNCVVSGDGSSVLINGVSVMCPEGDQPRLVCSADLSEDADKFALGSAACCLCNATAVECDPSLAEGDEPVNGLEACPDTTQLKGALQVPSSLMFNNDPYYCQTIGGRRRCFAY